MHLSVPKICLQLLDQAGMFSANVFITEFVTVIAFRSLSDASNLTLSMRLDIKCSPMSLSPINN